MRKTTLLLICITLLAAVLRLVWLDKIPHSINGDQLHYLLSAKSFFLTGRDLGQTTSLVNIFFFNYPPNDLVQAELPYFLEIFTVGPIGFSLLGAFTPNAVLGILTVFLIYLIIKKLLNEEIALFGSFVAAVNPWLISIGRTSYEMMPATFFYLCSLYILLIAKGWKILWAVPLFMLAFYSYIATKLILLPIALIFIAYGYFVVSKKKFIKQYIILLALLFVFVGFFVFQIKHSPGASRLSEITTPASYDITEHVNMVRKESIDSPFLSVFENKHTVFSNIILANTFDIFSPNYLFIHGDYFASLGKYGLFYPLDLIFLLLGAGYLFEHKKKLLLFLSALTLVSIIPEVAHYAKDGKHFTPHITLLFPFFIIMMGAGAWQLCTLWKGKKQKAIIAMTALIYAFSIGNFLHIYFFQMPLQAGFFNFSDRLLSRYIELVKIPGQKILIYSSDPRSKFQEYIFYNNLLTKDTSSSIKTSLKKSEHTLDMVTFTSCNRGMKSINNKDLIIVEAQCAMSFVNPKVVIPQLSDSGGVFFIYNDKNCKKYNLTPYVSGIKIHDFGVDKLSEKAFCERFIIK